MSKKLYLKTYGCQMNVYDGQRMAETMAAEGYALADDPAQADLVVLNTCHIREKAAEKVYSDIGRLKAVRALRQAAGGDMVIAVGGCVGQAEGAEMMRRAPAVDVVFGPQTYHRLPAMAAAATADRRAVGRARIVDTEFPMEDKFDHMPQGRRQTSPTAFLTIQEGCDKFCTFCVVPYTRGAEMSRPVAKIVSEAERLAAQGVAELTLLGQNVNAYHGPGPDSGEGGGAWNLARLLCRLADVPGIVRLRYTTSHPRDMDEELMAAHGRLAACMPYLHLPVQSGSDPILAAMNRGHTVDDYRRVIDRLRGHRPDIALSSDFIVGFPGETDADFAATLKLAQDIGYAQAYSFKYSARPGTPAAEMAGQVPEAAKAERLAALQDVLERQQAAFNAATIGRRLPVLLEKPGRSAGQLVGRSPYMQAVHVQVSEDANRLLGRVVEVDIVAAIGHSLEGRLPSDARAA